MRVQMSDLHAEDAGDPDGTADSLQAQRGHLGVVTVLQPHAERRQQGGPRQLQHTLSISRGFTTLPLCGYYRHCSVQTCALLKSGVQ